MNALRWFGSPLAGTAAVFAVLCLLAVPLHRLTSVRQVSQVKGTPPAESAAEIPAVLRVKLLAPATRLAVKTMDGAKMLDRTSLPAGEFEHDVTLVFTDDGLDLLLSADFGEAAPETAVFLTVMPDGYEEQTRYVTGSGLMEETLRYDWRHEH